MAGPIVRPLHRFDQTRFPIERLARRADLGALSASSHNKSRDDARHTTMLDSPRRNVPNAGARLARVAGVAAVISGGLSGSDLPLGHAGNICHQLCAPQLERSALSVPPFVRAVVSAALCEPTDRSRQRFLVECSLWRSDLIAT